MIRWSRRSTRNGGGCMSPRKPETNEQMRQQATEAILRGALDVFTERGFQGATTAEIAERAGVSKGLIYNYFRTKDDLIVALVEVRVGEALRGLADLPAGMGA